MSRVVTLLGNSFSAGDERELLIKPFFRLFTGSYKHRTIGEERFIEIEPFEEGFAVHYDSRIRPHCESFEKNRMAALDKASKRLHLALPLYLVVFALCGYVIYSGIFDEVAPLIIGNVILMGLLGVYVCMPLMHYKGEIKNTVFPEIIAFIGNYSYTPRISDKAGCYKEWDIIPSYDRERSEDHIQGEYKGVGIDLFETHLEDRRRDSDGDTSYVTVFDGVIICLDMHKNFNGKTIVKKDAGKLLNWLGNKFSSLETVRLEDPEFEKIFEVYSSDQIEARYLLTTSFMERLLRLVEMLGGKGVTCSFYQSKLLMLIPTKKNMFEPGSVFEPETFIDDAKSLLREIHTIHQIIDTLKLDQDIGM